MSKTERKTGIAGSLILFLFGVSYLIVICFGYTIIPYGRYGNDRPFESWQMWSIGVLAIAFSAPNIIRYLKTMPLKSSLKNNESKTDTH